jgi:hypothetical protein
VRDAVGELAGVVALTVAGAALVAAAVTLAATRRPGVALKVLLDLLLAAGLVRLTGDPTWSAVATSAAIVVLRRLIGTGLRTGARTWSGRDGGSRAPRLRLPPLERLLRPAWRP